MNLEASEVREVSPGYELMTTNPVIPEGYKRTEIGAIPQDWDVCSLGEIGHVIRGASPRPKGDKRFYGGTIPRLMVEDVTRDGKYVTPKVDFLTEAGAARSRPCKSGTLTIVCSGTVGVPAILEVDACIHDGFLALVGLTHAESSEFLYYQFDRLRSQFDSSATHGGIFTNLTTSGVREFEIPFPPRKEEQNAIATALSDVDALLEELDHLIAKKRDIKQATMQQLLTGQTRLPGFEEEWEEVRLGEIGHFLKGSGVRRHEAQSGNLPCVRYGEIYTVHHDVIGEFYSWISKDVANTAVQIGKGDLLFAGSGETKDEIGKCVAVATDKEAYAGGDIVVLRALKTDPVFMGYALNQPAVNFQKSSFGQGDAVVHISASALSQIAIRLPSESEQNAIAMVLSNMDAEIGALKQRRAKTAALKQAMMQELLTGRTRLVKPAFEGVS